MLRHSENVTSALLELASSYVSGFGKKSMTEKKHIDVSVIEAYVEGSISLKQASIMLERTPRTIMRLAAKYRDLGADGLIHGNTGKEPHNKIDSSTRKKILEVMQQESLRQMPYSLAIRYLRHEDIEVSAETLRRLLKEDPVLQQERKSNQHPLRRRRAQFGELIQLDGSPHHWFGPQRDRACLMVFIDDATSRITAAQFAPTENSLSYRELIEQHVWRYGIPLAFYSDRHSIFTPVGDHRTLRRNYQLTDYERVCRHLGIETIYAQTPQAKGRIERLNKTLQGRWPYQFAYEGITNIEQANANIDRFINDYNEEFSVQAREITDAHIPFGQNREQLHRICASWSEKNLGKRLSFSQNKKRFEVLIKEEKMRYQYRQVFLVYYERENRYEILYPPTKRLGKYVSLPFQMTDIKSGQEVVRYEETSKTIDYRINEIKKREPTAEYLFTEQNQ